MQREKKRGPLVGTRTPDQSMTNARAAWGEAMPEWVAVLAEACDRSSQAEVARRIGYSNSVVSTVLRKTYSGMMAVVEQAVRGALMGETVSCPVAGDIPRDQCLRYQKRAAAFMATSALAVQLYRACRGDCPHSRMKLTASTKEGEPENGL